MSDHYKSQQNKHNDSSKKVPPKEDRFVNPYNFVPLETVCYREWISEEGDSQTEKLTGYIECFIQLKTPIFIPNTSYDRAFTEDREDKPKSYDFFSYENLSGSQPISRKEKHSEPVIPGSEIRGVLRSVHEAAFNGCMSSVQENRQLSRRSVEQKKPGILRWNQEKNEWEIQPCERLMLNVTCEQEGHGQLMPRKDYYSLAEGLKIYVKSSKRRYKNRSYMNYVVEEYSLVEKKGDRWKIGYLHKGEPFGKKKHHESIFVESTEESCLPVSLEELQRLKKVLSKYNSEENRHLKEKFRPHRGYATYEKNFSRKIAEKKDVLVYYSISEQDTQIVAQYLSPSMLSQEVFLNDIEHLLKSNGGYQPCVDRNCVCKTCQLFGMVSKEKGNSLGSRLRIEDACVLDSLRQDDTALYYYPEIELPEMGEPKPGSAEFYVSRPLETEHINKSDHWTYDYVQLPDKKIEKDKLRTPLTASEIKIRGRKFYWHHEGWKSVIRKVYQYDSTSKSQSANAPEAEKGNKKMIQIIRPLRQKLRDSQQPLTFKFNVYFEQITQQELTNLLWTLDFEDPKCAHKIGRAKPLGLGSIQIQVDQVYQRRINKSNGEWELTPISREHCKLEVLSSSRQTMKRIATWKPLDFAQQVSYPQIDEANNGSKVNDAASHKWFTANRKAQGKFDKTLPTVEEELNTESKWLYKKRK
ncbi:TIGR03986 family type III CRISPR-associated RAMP protein [Saccharibacillus alkalitolerans]|uniref:TIGR03986 family CRISPR-associated RAMP protein n=1 Tax=Saccharibacillus alkalitolerans TaxID=2705290 RepID=A0ABX0EZ94_9BACL|nr:TIGR03986 family CRISPR-associated RAMP protein [Saccharibacillus alkalitolerans]NGZ74061.1 TIGR03986 family CRISPR-associated RAMP protein [Saccharibacillus alkalitolerans]